MPSDVAETAARIRAARGYSGLSQKDLAKKLGHSVETMSRIENGRRAASADETEAIARICAVPMLFMETGFALIEERGAEATQGDLMKRVIALEQKLQRDSVEGPSHQPDLVLVNGDRVAVVQLKTGAGKTSAAVVAAVEASLAASRSGSAMTPIERAELLERGLIEAVRVLDTASDSDEQGPVAPGHLAQGTEGDAG